ncbi:phage portal protein [Leisingera sp. MMG026]|uniref:phage portal protein n=1 Tax=Leisingera sp. MMG026 TaxID=2909982 RepID=UPI001F1D9708|nr:phage portal protein [Leisingera sp. MMG026]MCF6432656.1 phage portal protein [Leisingera sp. MMG026]
MSTDTAPQNDADAVTITVQKSDVESLLSSRSEAGLDGEFLWPIEPRNLALLYRASAEHGRAIQIKAESAFGGGLIGGADRIEDLCETGAAEMFTLLGLDLETYANAFLQKIRSSDGERIIGLRRLPAISMCRYRAGFMQRVGLPNGQTRKITFTADEIIHLREPCPMGRRYALPTWIGAEGMLELAYAATRYNASFFKNNAIPEYAITFKGATPTAAQKDAVREFFRNDFQGMDNAHRTLILTAGEDCEIEIKKLTSDVKDGDFLKLIDAARDRMPVAHGVPPRMLGIMTAGQLGGGGEVSGQLFTFEHLTLKPKRRRMLDQIRPVLRELGLKPGDTDKPLGPNEVLFRPLDLTPPKDDAEDLPGLVTSGILTPEEAKALLPHQGNASQGGSAAPTGPVERSAPANPIDTLAALLARL